MPEEQTHVQDPSAPTPEPSAPAPAPTPAPVAPAPAATPAAAQPAPASQGEAPWTADLNAMYSDESQRQAVDQYLREKVQPYVTNLEQGVKPAKELFEAFAEEPDATFAEVAAELYGADAAKAITDYVAALENAPAEPQAQQTQAPTQLPPEVQRLIEREQRREEEEAFDTEFNRIKQTPGNEGIERDLFIPFVAQTGSFESAVDAYHNWEDRFRESSAPGTGLAPAPVGLPSPPPPVVGAAGTEGGTPPPAQKEYGSLNEAIQDFFDEQGAQGVPAAPPIPSG